MVGRPLGKSKKSKEQGKKKKIKKDIKIRQGVEKTKKEGAINWELQKIFLSFKMLLIGVMIW